MDSAQTAQDNLSNLDTNLHHFKTNVKSVRS
ncbi:unnamed protein product (plasmid) [Mycetohabitans rhizoxinica HKI 454]|uniref:Uncharacterized protein n=1 Tax=Mycetohabitans rhizoxinica (strain DSM 19002 / CIP 109453 / HKI 454) TaxID=882378 RepID=E5ATZ6_MYCRK|nr:unnamed protein product [Mycetohabitans rhizoxinica HKI 454]